LRSDRQQKLSHLTTIKGTVMTKTLLRYTLDISNIEELNISIQAYEKMISFYRSWKEKNGEYEYVDERISYLNSVLSEYLIAREFSKEGVKTFGSEFI